MERRVGGGGGLPQHLLWMPVVFNRRERPEGAHSFQHYWLVPGSHVWHTGLKIPLSSVFSLESLGLGASFSGISCPRKGPGLRFQCSDVPLFSGFMERPRQTWGKFWHSLNETPCEQVHILRCFNFARKNLDLAYMWPLSGEANICSHKQSPFMSVFCQGTSNTSNEPHQEAVYCNNCKLDKISTLRDVLYHQDVD